MCLKWIFFTEKEFLVITISCRIKHTPVVVRFGWLSLWSRQCRKRKWRPRHNTPAEQTPPVSTAPRLTYSKSQCNKWPILQGVLNVPWTGGESHDSIMSVLRTVLTAAACCTAVCPSSVSPGPVPQSSPSPAVQGCYCTPPASVSCCP